jgi:hypothetical protein
VEHANATIVASSTLDRVSYWITDGKYQGIFFTVPSDEAYRAKLRIGETVRVKFHPDDQFAYEER